MEEVNHFDAQVEAMERDWAEKVKSGPNDVTDGEHPARCDKFDVVLSEASQKLQIVRRHVVTDGTLKGKTVQDYLGLTNQYGPYFLNQWAKALNVTMPKINFGKKGESVADRIAQIKASLSAISKAAMETEVTIKVKTKDDFRNVAVFPKK